jgi:hypothetical protein
MRRRPPANKHWLSRYDERMNSIQLAFRISGSFLVMMLPNKLPAQTSQPQAPAPSLAEVARQARAARKNVPIAAIVWTNYSLRGGSGGVSVVGQPAKKSSSAESIGDGEGNRWRNGGASIAERKRFNAPNEIAGKLAQAKERLTSLRVDLDLAQRMLVLDQNQFDSSPGRATDRDGAAQLRVESQQLENKAREVTSRKLK